MMKNLSRFLLVLSGMVLATAGWCQMNMGLEYYREKDYDQAMKTFSAVLDENPANVQARYLYGLCLLRLERPEEAAEAFRMVLEEQPEHGKAHTNLARALVRMKEYEKALPHAEKGAALTDDSGAYNVVGLAQMGLEEYGLAAEAFSKAIDKDPGNAWAYNNRGYTRVLEGLGIDDGSANQALRDFNRALEIDPENELFQQNQAYVEQFRDRWL